MGKKPGPPKKIARMINVGLTPDLDARMRREAEAKHQSCTVVIRLALEAYLPPAEVKKIIK